MSDRRTFIKTLGLAAAAGVLPGIGAVRNARAGTNQVVVIGGGFGGSTAAKYIKLWGQGRIDVTLVDRNASFASPILSNLVLNGQKTIANLSFDLALSTSRNGVNFVPGEASIDDGVVRVMQTGGRELVLPYDKLVVSPGIDFNYPPGMQEANGDAADGKLPIPHAWKSGAQVENLKAQISAMPKRTGKFVLCIPEAPYRCPPGPYERACVVADILKRVKGGGKVIIFDANPGITAEQHTFTTAFAGLYGGIIEYVPKARLLSVTAGNGQFGTKTATVEITKADGTRQTRTETCHVLNVIPEAKAGKVLSNAGLLGANGRWAEVDLYNYASLANPRIHVVGDSHLSNQPKAGHIANSEAKVCADAIVREFGILPQLNRETDPEVPVTNSACYSPVSATTASWLTVEFRYDRSTQKMVRVDTSLGESESPSSDNYKMMLAWSRNLFRDTFSL